MRYHLCFHIYNFPYKREEWQGITLNELNETMEEITEKVMLIINAIDKCNAETHGLLRTIINEIKDSNSKQDRLS